MSETNWIPPGGGPERPLPPPPPRRPAPDPPSARSGAGLHVVAGLVAIGVGVAAVVLAESMKLDAERLLTGGSYVKDEYRLFMVASGAALAILGAVLILLAAVGNSRSATRTTFVVACLLTIIVVAEGAILVAAVNEKERDQGTAEAAPSFDDEEPAFEEPPPAEPETQPQPDPDPEPMGEANGGFIVSCGSGGCFANKDVPVYAVEVGDGCLKRGAPGDWQGTGTGLFECSVYSIRPPRPGLAPDPTYAVACTSDGCFQASLRVRRPAEAAACDSASGDGTWTRVTTIDASDDEIYRCL